MDRRFDAALFTPTEVADYLRIHQSTLRHWFGTVTRFDASDNQASIPFAGLVEAQVVKSLRTAGLKLSAIRDATEQLRTGLDHPHPLIWRGLAHDGVDILRPYENQWERVRDQQPGIPEVIELGLHPVVSWAPDDYPERLRLQTFDRCEVVVDPRFSFGQPIHWESGVRVEDIIDSVNAGDELDVVVDEFGVSASDVFNITQFELARQRFRRADRAAA